MIRRLSALVACFGVAAMLTLLLIGPSAALIFSSGPPATGITGSITSASTGCIQIGELDGDPTITCVTRLIVSNATLTDTGNGGAALTTGAGGGSGTGDVSSNTSTSVDNELALFAGTTGKSIKRATTTGLLKGTAGVLSTAVAGTDYVVPGGSVASATTATQLAANGTNCAPGQAARGIDQFGTAEECVNLTDTNTTTSIVNELVQFADTSGKLLKRSTLTGLMKSTNGVPSAAVAGTDYVAPGTAVTDTQVPDLNTLSTGLLPSRCVETDVDGKLVSATGLCGTGGGGSSAFNAITSGTNTTAAMNVGAGASLQSTGGPIDATKLGGVDASAYAKLNGPQVLTQTQNVPRVVPLTIGVPAANQIQPNCDTTDIGTLDAIPADLFVVNPLCTGSNPRPEQEIELRLFSSTPRAITWDSGYCETNGYTLLTSTTGNGETFDHIKFRRNTLSNCWGVIANTRGAQRGVTQLATSTSTTTAYACNPALAHLCRQQITGASGTITVTMTSTVPDGTLTRLAFRCTNAQSLVMSTANFMPSPNIPIPTQCPAAVAGTGWFEIGVAYSQLDGKHQILATN